MPVTSVTKDPDALTMTVVADFPAPVERLWQAYADPRQLEKFWGPPACPAMFSRHDVVPAGRSAYAMTMPDGAVSRGYWEWLAVDPQRSFEVLDGFAHEDGTPNAEMPSMRMVFTFEPTGDGSRVTTTAHFNTAEELAQLLDMGMEDGMREAMGQMDQVLDDLRTFAADRPASAQILSDTQVRVSRVIAGSVEVVWRAHHDKDLIQQWMLGPDGWTMPVCEVATHVGDTYRYEWANGEESFGFEGELLESAPPHRSVTSERMIGMPGEGVRNEMTLTPVSGGTLLSTVITYPNAQIRDMILDTGMAEGMETSYQRLEAHVLTPV
ncbi:MAG: SRPBCC family protein [Ornithinimicrobium sp.]